MSELLKRSRVILYYNGAISALTLFVQHPDKSVCTPSPLPVLSSVLEEDEVPLNRVRPQFYDSLKKQMDIIPKF